MTPIFKDFQNVLTKPLQTKLRDTLRLSDITSVYKKLDPSDKAKYKSISILPLVSKVFEKLMYDQLHEYIKYFFDKFLCGFRRAHSTQHALFRLLPKWLSEGF